jgi:hypothetical protein
VTVTISGVNDAPVAVADTATANEDGPPVMISVLGNDTDADSTETKTVQSVDNTGTLGWADAFGANVGYDPNGAFNSLKAGATATDTFTYTMVDSQGATSTATVTVTITGQNDAPTAVADTAATNEDATNVAIDVLGNDTDPDSGDTKTVQSVGALSNGGSITNNGTNVTFTPGASFQDLQVGSTRDTSFTYTMVDGSGATSNATATITVTGVNDAPVAVNDGTYTGVVGNTKATLSDASAGPKVTLSGNLLNQNDTDADAGDTKTASLVSANSASVTVNGDGSFIYLPQLGTQNTNVTFTYKVTDSQGAASNTATVTLNVVERVWYVDNTLGANGTGRSESPFNNLASAAAVDDAGDYLFLQGGGGQYTGGIALNNSEQVLGQPNGLSVTGAASSPIVAAGGTNPVITNATASGSGITLANDNNIQRVDVTNANTHGVTGTNVTNLTIGANTTISGSGGSELRLTGNATGTISVGSTITNGASGIGADIAGRTGGTTTLSGNITSGGGTGVSVSSNSGGSIAFAGSVTTTAGTGVSESSNSGGTISFTNAITASGGPGINLNSNPNTSMSFTGTLQLSTGTSAAFAATGGGTVTSTSTASTITTTTGTGVSVVNTSIGASDLTFRSVDVDGNDTLPTNGILLNNTGSSGGLIVTGTGSTGSGGTIRDTSGDPVSATSTTDLSLDGVTVTSNLGTGIDGSSVDGMVLDQVTITDNGDNAATDDSGIDLIGLTGTNGGAHPTSITNSTITNNFEFEIQITNSSGTLGNLQMSGNTVSANGLQLSHGNLFNFLALGNANMTLNMTSGSFTGNTDTSGGKIVTATGTQCDHSGTGGTMTCNISNTTYTNNNVGPQASVANGGNMQSDFNTVTATGGRAHGVNYFVAASYTGSFGATLRNSTVGTLGVPGSASSLGFGVRMQMEGVSTAASVRLAVTNNIVQETSSFNLINVNQGIAGQTSTTPVNATITGNTLRNSGARAILVSQNNATDADSAGNTCADVSGNTMSNIVGQAGDGTRIRLRRLDANDGGQSFRVRQADANTLASANSSTTAQLSLSGTLTFNGGACLAP